MEVSVDFATSDCNVTQTFRRSVPATVGDARLLAEILVAGPTPTERARRASQPFPQGSRVRSVNLRDGELTVDFNERLQNAMLPLREYLEEDYE